MTDLRDQLDADQLARIAAQLAARVRDLDVDTNARWLARALPDPDDWFRLAFVLAAAVPDDQPWSQLTAWTRPLALADDTQPVRRGRRSGTQPCGTPAAATRHRYYGEPLCVPCIRAERDRDRQRKRIRRAA